MVRGPHGPPNGPHEQVHKSAGKADLIRSPFSKIGFTCNNVTVKPESGGRWPTVEYHVHFSELEFVFEH